MKQRGTKVGNKMNIRKFFKARIKKNFELVIVQSMTVT